MPKEKLSKYQYRNAALRELGFDSYKEYLQSEYWQKVKEKYPLDDWVCLRCLARPEVLHHVRYDSWTLVGLDLACLAPLCHSCHAEIELDDGKKTTMEEANRDLFASIYQNIKKSSIVREWFKTFSSRPRRKDAKTRRRAFTDKREKKRQENMPVAKPGSFYFKAGKKQTRKRHGLF